MEKDNKPRLDLMIDIETLGTEPGCIILSVAMKDFRLVSTEDIVPQHEMMEHISVLSQLFIHSLSDYKTEEWWSDRSKEAIADALQGQKESVNVEDTMTNLYNIFTNLCSHYDVYFWGRGVGSFDLPILNDCMRRVWEKRHPDQEYKSPIPYYKAMDVRTLVNYCKALGMEMPKIETPHIAMADVEKQITEVHMCTEFMQGCLQGTQGRGGDVQHFIDNIA